MRLQFETFSTGGDEHQHARHAARRPTRRRRSWASTTCSRSTPTSRRSPAPQRDRHGDRSTCWATCPATRSTRSSTRTAGGRAVAQIDGQPVQLNGIERSKVYQAGVIVGRAVVPARRASTAPATTTGATRATSSASTARPTTARTSTSTTARRRSASRSPASKTLDGLKVAFGPQLWWGANPLVMLKYRRRVGDDRRDRHVHHEDIASQSAVTSSSAIPHPAARGAPRSRLATKRGPWGIEVGGIWAGSTQGRRHVPDRRGERRRQLPRPAGRDHRRRHLRRARPR